MVTFKFLFPYFSLQISQLHLPENRKLKLQRTKMGNTFILLGSKKKYSENRIILIWHYANYVPYIVYNIFEVPHKPSKINLLN
jgi:hypothetical protein